MRRQITEIDQLAEDLPDLTPQQMEFVRHILDGKTASDAYRIAYNSHATNPSIWAEASKLRNSPKVALWLSVARKAGLGTATVTLANHLAELETLREIAKDTGNIGAAVQAEQLRGKAMGHYVDRVETTDLTDIRSELAEIAKISPKLAEAYAKEKGVNYH